MLGSREVLGVVLISLWIVNTRTKKRKYINVVFVQITIVCTFNACNFFISKVYYFPVHFSVDESLCV